MIKIDLITGFLGAGKTTLLNEVLSNQEGYKVAVIVNDIGEKICKISDGQWKKYWYSGK